jgi:hypothetical protein
MIRFLLVVLLLAGAALAPSGSASVGGDWPALHRPLHLPRLAHGQRCPLSSHARGLGAKEFGVSGGIGPGPAYPMLPSASLVVSYRPQEWGRGPWAGEKVFWLVHPSYKGPVLIRGRRLDGSGLMRFDGGALPSPEIPIAAGPSQRGRRGERADPDQVCDEPERHVARPGQRGGWACRRW